MADAPEPLFTWRDGLEIMHDETLVIDSAVCARGEMPASIDRLRADGHTLPEAREYCEAVINEEAFRDRLTGLYEYFARRMGLQQGETVRATVAASAIRNQSTFEIGGAINPLACPFAFHAGVIDGVERADQPPFQPQVTDEQINQITEACFAASSETPTLHGYVAGARFGQSIGQVPEITTGAVNGNRRGSVAATR